MSTKFRRLGLLKPKREKVSRKVERVPQLRLMGLKHRKDAVEGEELKTSHQIKINGLGVNALGLLKGDKIDILQREDNTFLIAKVTGEKEGRMLSANKGTESLSVTFGNAHNAMKEVSTAFEITDQVVTAQDIEANDPDSKAQMGNYNWYVLIPITSTTESIETTNEPIIEKNKEKKEDKVKFF